MNTPAITPAQILSAIAALLGLLVALTLVDDDTSQAILAAASTFVPSAFALADAIIRAARARAIGDGAIVRGGKLYSASAPPK